MTELVRDIPKVAVAVYAHPDDAEVSCGGTLALWARGGCEVHIVVATSGEKGTSDPNVDPTDLVMEREKEMAEASAIIETSSRILLGYPDGELEDTAELRCVIVRIVRELKPEVLVCPDPTASFFGQDYVNHRDHRVIGWASIDGVAPAAGLPHYFPETGPPHQVSTIYMSGTLEPNVVIDISTTLEMKVAALQCHRSQLGGSSQWLEALVRQRASDAGAEAGVRWAEAFRRQRLTV